MLLVEEKSREEKKKIMRNPSKKYLTFDEYDLIIFILNKSTYARIIG